MKYALTSFKNDLDGGDFRFTSGSFMCGNVKLNGKSVIEIGFDIEIFSIEILIGSVYESDITKLGSSDIERLKNVCISSLQTITGTTVEIENFHITS